MKTNLATLLSLALLFSFAPQVAEAYGARDKDSEKTASPKIAAMLMYADWCGSCKVLDPKIEEVKTDFAGKPVLFTRVDQTNDFTKEQSRYMAELMGLGDIYAAQGGRTGYLILIDLSTGEEVGRITREHDKDEIKETILAALR